MYSKVFLLAISIAARPTDMPGTGNVANGASIAASKLVAPPVIPPAAPPSTPPATGDAAKTDTPPSTGDAAKPGAPDGLKVGDVSPANTPKTDTPAVDVVSPANTPKTDTPANTPKTDTPAVSAGPPSDTAVKGPDTSAGTGPKTPMPPPIDPLDDDELPGPGAPRSATAGESSLPPVEGSAQAAPPKDGMIPPAAKEGALPLATQPPTPEDAVPANGTVYKLPTSSPIGFGSVLKNHIPDFPITIDGASKPTGLTLDANWRWVHTKEGYRNCFNGGVFDGSWDKELCPDAATCAKNCLIDGVPEEYWEKTYGIHIEKSSVKMDLVTGSNVGGRLFLLDPSKKNYMGFPLLNKEFTFTVDSSQVGCGLNGALYFVSMDTKNPNAPYGVGYGDAQCPSDIKYVNGIPNVDAKNPIRPCASEMDIWEANQFANALTPHSCTKPGTYVCPSDQECGVGEQRYQGTCDKDGADLNPYRVGSTDLYGPGKQIDSTKPVTVVTQFITSDGTDKGELKEIKRFYKQGEKVIPGGSITDESNKKQKSEFGEQDIFTKMGGMAGFGKKLENEMTLVLSIWGDSITNMNWLDSTTKPSKAGITKGTLRGPCKAGTFNETLKNNQKASVTFSDISLGKIATTAAAPETPAAPKDQPPTAAPKDQAAPAAPAAPKDQAPAPETPAAPKGQPPTAAPKDQVAAAAPAAPKDQVAAAAPKDQAPSAPAAPKDQQTPAAPNTQADPSKPDLSK